MALKIEVFDHEDVPTTNRPRSISKMAVLPLDVGALVEVVGAIVGARVNDVGRCVGDDAVTGDGTKDGRSVAVANAFVGC